MAQKLEDADDNYKVKERYAARQDKALATIVLLDDPSLLYLLGNPDNPKSVWRKLEEQLKVVCKSFKSEP